MLVKVAMGSRLVGLPVEQQQITKTFKRAPHGQHCLAGRCLWEDVETPRQQTSSKANALSSQSRV
jgi:hypothetical protein